MLPFLLEDAAMLAVEEVALFKGMSNNGLAAGALFGVTAGLMANSPQRAMAIGASVGATAPMFTRHGRNFGTIAMSTVTSTAVGLVTYSLKEKLFTKREAERSYHSYVNPERER